jgi:hypothetical protein
MLGAAVADSVQALRAQERSERFMVAGAVPLAAVLLPALTAEMVLRVLSLWIVSSD